MWRAKHRGFTLIELLIVVAIILIIAGIAIPNLLRSKIAANESSAVASIYTLTSALVTYSSNYNAYPPTLAALGPATTPSATAANLVDSLLAVDPAVRSGYSIAYTAGGNSPITTYTIVATPVSTSTGQRRFFTDQSSVLRQTTDGSTPTVNSPLIP